MVNQCKCGSSDFFVKKQGNNTGLYCSMCGRWQKWLNKDEVRLFEHNNPPKQKKQTNADRIRTMTDEELAEFFAQKNPCNYYCNYIGKTCQGVSCKQGILEWLQSEAEQEGKM